MRAVSGIRTAPSSGTSRPSSASPTSSRSGSTRPATNGIRLPPVVAWDPTLMQVTGIQTPELQDIAFKSHPLVGEPRPAGHLPHPRDPLRDPRPAADHHDDHVVPQSADDHAADRRPAAASHDEVDGLHAIDVSRLLPEYAGCLVLYWLVSNVFTMFQQYFTIGLGLLGGGLLHITGHDYQPSWAHVPTTTPAPVAALAADGSNGHGDAVTNHEIPQHLARARPSRVPPDDRDPVPSRGRKRGKRETTGPTVDDAIDAALEGARPRRGSG